MKKNYQRLLLSLLITFIPFMLGLAPYDPAFGGTTGLALPRSGGAGFVFPKLSTQFNLRSEGQRVVEVKIDPKLLPLIQKEQTLLEEEVKKRLPQKFPFQNFPFKITPKEKEGLFFKRILPVKKGLLLEREHLFFKDYFFKEKVNLDYKSALGGLEKEQQAELEPILKTVNLIYELELPGKIIKANSQKIWPDKAEWQLNLGKIYVVKAHSQIIRWHLIILTGILILILIGLVGAEIIKHQSSPESVSR